MNEIKQKDNEDIFNKHRLLKQTKEELEKKESLKLAKILYYFINLFLISLICLLTCYMYFKIEYLEENFTGIQYMKYFHQRIYDISDARFYARKYELIIK